MDLTDTLKKEKPGTWVVLDDKMTKVVASAPTPDAAVKEAEKAGEPKGVLMLVHAG